MTLFACRIGLHVLPMDKFPHTSLKYFALLGCKGTAQKFWYGGDIHQHMNSSQFV
jgi:hypothetical protein